MLPKKNRLVSKYDFDRVRYHADKEGTKGVTPYFYIYWISPEDYNGETKVGFVVSKKYHKSAVVRNRIKRMYRELIRKNFGKIKPRHLIVIQPRRLCLSASYEEISADFNKFISENHITG